MSVRVKILGTILHSIERNWGYQLKKTELWMEGKKEKFCV